MSAAETDSGKSNLESLFISHEFAIRRVHSLLGIIPLGLYMLVHLSTNASLLNGSETFQRAVFLIHSPGKLLPIIEWGAIFLPLIFHAAVGVWIAKTGHSNADRYDFASNLRYVFQRWTGVIALVYLFFHILHMHGWFHAHVWLEGIRHVGFAQFRPYNAASTVVNAMEGFVWPAFYLVGVMSCVFHLANGLWTAGITWGLWISPTAQARATKVCTVLGLGMAVIAGSAWWASVWPSTQEIIEYKAVEDRMYEASVEAGLVPANPEKRWETGESLEAESLATPAQTPTDESSTSSDVSSDEVSSPEVSDH